MAVAAHHHEVGAAVGRVRGWRPATSMSPLAMRLTSTVTPWRARCSPMSAPVISSLLPLLRRRSPRRPPWRARGSGIASAIARAAVRPPSQHTITRSSLSPLLLDIGHDDHRPPGLEQRALDHQFLGGALLGVAPGRPPRCRSGARSGRTGGGAGEAGVEHARLRRHAGLWPPPRIGRRGLRGLAVFLALHLDQVGRDAAEHGSGITGS